MALLIDHKNKTMSERTTSSNWALAIVQALEKVGGIAEDQCDGESRSRIQSLLAELTIQHSQQPALWLSGGFASAMIALLPGAQLLEHAVFKGLVFDYQLTRQDLA